MIPASPTLARITLSAMACSLIACAALPATARLAEAAEQNAPVVCFAASSLATALDAVARAWMAATGKRLACSYASSAVLARQIEAGAPADLFASADRAWTDWAAARHLLRPGSLIAPLGNRLVLIAPRGESVALRIAPGFPLAQALGSGRLAMGNPATVPAGAYARAALSALGVWGAVQEHIIATENVRAALAFVARGEAPLGIVYETDALSGPNVEVVDAFPAETHPPIVYAFAITAASRNPDADAFLAYLRTPTALSMFAAHGFTVRAEP
jgi:molybdate transport system substrate-binding protein